MSMTINKELPNPAALKAEFPVPEHIKEIKAARDKEIAAVFRGESDKFLVIVGPCSADNEESVCEYTRRLARVNEQVKDRLILIPRIYTNKPRTTGEGYKGMLHQPDPDKAPDLLGGIIAIRKMHMRAIEETGLTCADEMLYPENRSYLDDLLSYEAIGARSVENQQHRLTCSSMDTRRHEKPHLWRSCRHDELHQSRPKRAQLHLSRVRRHHHRQPARPRYFARRR